MDKRKQIEITAALGCFLIAAALLYMAQYAQLLAVAIPCVLVFAVVNSGYAFGGAAAVLSLASGLLYSVTVAALAMAAFLPIVFAAGYVIREKKRFRNSVLLSCAAALAGAALAVFILMQMTGKHIVDYLVDYVGIELGQLGDEQVKLIYTTFRSADVVSGAVTQQALLATPAAEAIQILQDMARDFFQVFFVYFMILYAMIAGFLSYIIPRATAKKRGISVVPIPPFSDYTLPKRLWLGAIGTIVFAMIGAEEGWPAFDLLYVTIYNVFAVFFMAQGLCLIDYWMKERKLTTGIRMLLHVIAVALLSGWMLPLVGLAENAFGIRKRMEAMKGGEAQ